MNKILLALAGLSVGLLTIGVQAGVEEGKALFQKKMCFACHGAGKKGGDLKDSKLDKAAIIKYIKDPKTANQKATMMAVKATDAELGSLADYVLSLRK